jgi:7-carboxy-7-deazaguanine synthase
MFGTNALATKKDYANLPGDVLRVTSIFHTLQGEGPLAGHPCVFIRLTGCHRSCTFCDTYFEKGEDMPFHSIIGQARKAVNPEYRRPDLLVITGGEPMLQRNLVPFLWYVQQSWALKAQIESAGDMLLEGLPSETVLVVSPKRNEKTGLYHDLPQDVWARADAIKCVVSADASDYYHGLPYWLEGWAREHGRDNVFLTPMNTYNRPPNKEGTTFEERVKNERVSFWDPGLLNMEQNRRNHEYAAAMCLKHGYRLSLQTHLIASLP